jgi:hypothetical protein
MRNYEWINNRNYDILYSEIKKILNELEKKEYSILYSNGISSLLWVLTIINEDVNITFLDEVLDK